MLIRTIFTLPLQVIYFMKNKLRKNCIYGRVYEQLFTRDVTVIWREVGKMFV
jgi:hypothetical protein